MDEIRRIAGGDAFRSVGVGRRMGWLIVTLVLGISASTSAETLHEGAWSDARGSVAAQLRAIVQPAAAEDAGNAQAPAELSDDGLGEHLTDADELPPSNRFGTADSWRWAVYGGAAFDLRRDGEQYNLHWSASYFFTDDFNVSFELGGLLFNEGDDAGSDHDTAGANFNVLFRWHFISEPTWSLYVDGGAGMLLAGEEIPRGGSNFNFTPQAGFGASFELDDDADVRLITGVRWHHISNANTAGSDMNPGRDSIMGYIGLDFPF